MTRSPNATISDFPENGGSNVDNDRKPVHQNRQKSARADHDRDAQTEPEKQFDANAFAMNIARAMESSGQALAAYLKPRGVGEVQDKPPSEVAEVIKTLTSVAQYWMSDKDRAQELQQKMGKAYLDLWGSAMRRMAGEDARPAIEPSPRDKRFQDPEWKSNQFFDFVMQLYLLTTQWANDLVRNAEGLDPTRCRRAISC